ncbi:MAG: PAS domain S-box protein, partial [Desulfobacteraceae bacterium]|nr:PAS domain S-box protein [Desulfobacteraceae bacterium]
MKSKFDLSILKTILETTPNPYVLKDKNCIYVYANKAFSDFLGKDIQDIIGKTDYDLFPEEEAEKYIIGDKAVMSGGEQQQEEWKVQGDTGVKWLQVLKTPVLDKENMVVGLLCSVTDISKLKRSEEMLHENEENFRALIETIDDIVLVGNPDGSIIYSNPAASLKLGYNQKELCKLKIIDLHPPYLRKEAAFIVSEMISGNQDVCPLPVLGKNGNLILVETRVWLGKWNGIDCIFGISKDLSKEQEALQKFDQIFRMNPALMAVNKIPDQTFTDVNDAFLQTLGYSKEEI